LGAVTLGAVTLGAVTLGAVSLGAVSVGAVSLGAVSLGAVTLGAAGRAIAGGAWRIAGVRRRRLGRFATCRVTINRRRVDRGPQRDLDGLSGGGFRAMGGARALAKQMLLGGHGGGTGGCSAVRNEFSRRCS